MPVTRPLGEGAQGRDSQIEAAVKEWLAQLSQSAARPDASRLPNRGRPWKFVTHEPRPRLRVFRN
jgi:hypothetical protein